MLPLLLLTLLGLGLRLHRLDFQPLWGDEGWSFYFAWMPLPDMLALTARDIHPPLYYTLLHGWLGLAGGTPQAARLLSILVGTLLIPLVHRVAGCLFDRRAGLLSAGVVAIAPLAIYYAQEVRMYGLVMLLGLASMCFFFLLLLGGFAAQQQKRASFERGLGVGVGYVLTTAAALYTMYYAAFVVLAQLAFLVVWRVAVRGEPRRLRRVGGAMLATGALYLPWAFYAGSQLMAYVQGKRTAEGYVPLDLARYVAAHLVAFSLGHLSEALVVLAWATLGFGALAVLGLLYRQPRLYPQPLSPLHLRRGEGGKGDGVRCIAAPLLLFCYVALPLLAGYLVNRVYPFTPRYFERTLLLAAPAWWLLIGAGLAWLWRRGRAALAGVGVVLVAITMVALFDFYNVPRYRGEDYRPLLTYVRSHSTPEDVILASYQWQLGLYEAYLPAPHARFYIVPGWGEGWADDPARMRGDLEVLMREHPRLWFPAYQSLGRLWETRVETLLNQLAYPAQVDWNLPGTKLTLYGRGEDLQAVTPIFAQMGKVEATNFANRLALEQVEVGSVPVEAGRGVLPVSLLWRKQGSLGSEHRIALRLTDVRGQSWATRDSLPQGGRGSFAALAIGETLTDHHGLLIPAGTPPGEYQLRLSVIDIADDHPLDLLDAQGQPQGVEALLTAVRVVAPSVPLAAEALPIQHPLRADFDGRVRLLGYSLGDTPVKAGESLSFSLFWQALADLEEPYSVFAQLQDEAGQPVALSETPPVYPTDRWTAGMLLRDPHQVPLPPGLAPGEYRLAVGLLRPDGARLPVGRGDQVVLTRVPTTQRAHTFTPPSPEAPWYAADARFGDSARLAAYELHAPQLVKPGESIRLVLHWQALQPFARSYTVFVHLVDAQDRIYGQRDQLPGGGRFPTTGWVSGEYLADAYQVPVNPDTPPGQYWLEVGLYDPLDGARLPVTDAQGGALGNRLLLTASPIEVGGNIK